MLTSYYKDTIWHFMLINMYCVALNAFHKCSWIFLLTSVFGGNGSQICFKFVKINVYILFIHCHQSYLKVSITIILLILYVMKRENSKTDIMTSIFHTIFKVDDISLACIHVSANFKFKCVWN